MAWRGGATLWPPSVTSPWSAVLLGITIHRIQGPKVKNTCPRNVLGVVIKKQLETRQPFNKPTSRGKFNSHPLKKKVTWKMATSLNSRKMQILNYNEVSHHTGLHGHRQALCKQTALERVWRQREPSSAGAHDVNWQQSLWGYREGSFNHENEVRILPNTIHKDKLLMV